MERSRRGFTDNDFSVVSFQFQLNGLACCIVNSFDSDESYNVFVHKFFYGKYVCLEINMHEHQTFYT